MDKKVKELLVAHSLNKTPCRLDMLNVLHKAEKALTEQEMKELLEYDFDRVTVFRTLRTFIEVGLVHHVTVNKNEVRYALSRPELKADDKKGHAHLHCDRCGEVLCLGGFSVDESIIPQQFQVIDYELIINGLCSKCN